MSDNFFSYTSEDLQKIYVDDYNMIDQFALTGSLWLWGENSYGQLGNNAQGDRSSPVQTVSGGTNWAQVSAGKNHTAGIKTDGTLWLWGWNSYGQLGNNARVNRSSPVQTVSGGTNWKQVSCGSVNDNYTKAHTAAIKTDGTLWLWGNGEYGQLGNNVSPIYGRSSPVQTVSGGNNWQQVSCGGYVTGAIKTDGTLWLWGASAFGQLGDNDTAVRKSSPVQTISQGNNWKIINVGDKYTTAIKTDGTLWVWGYNLDGQLGTNNTTNYSSPVQTVSGGTNWKMVSAGNLFTAAIKTDGTLWLWGYNAYGQLGDNTRVKRSSPVQTISGGTNWKQIGVGFYVSLGIKTDGTLWTWGGADSFSNRGQLGNNTLTRVSSPIQTVSGGNNWKSVSFYNTASPAAIYFYDADNLYPSS